MFSSMGCEDSELDKMKNEGLLAPESYFYGALLDAARGDKKNSRSIWIQLNKIMLLIY